MGLFDFVKDAGEKIFGKDDDKPAARPEGTATANRARSSALAGMLSRTGIPVLDLGVRYEDGVATVTGIADTQTDREKIVLLLGNTQGVSRVDDRMEVKATEPEATMYTVQPGDSLSKIAKAHYGNAMKYMVIFEANTPMLKDPNKIYPGQVLRIPPLPE